MGAYIVRRLVAMVLMLIALSMITFLLFNALPADPARLTCGKACTPQVIEANRHRLGLDKPLYEQYARLREGHLRRPDLRLGHGDLRVQRAVPGLLVPQAGRGDRPDRGPAAGDRAAGAGRVRPLDRGRGLGRDHRRAQARQVAGPHHHGLRADRLLVPVVLHRPAADLLRPAPAGLVPFVNYEPGMRSSTDPIGWFQVFILPWTALACSVRRVLRPADPQPDAGDPGRGLHPHGPGQGPAPSAP